MDLPDALGRNASEISEGIEPMIGAADIDIVDVEQQETASARAQFGEELPLARLVVCKGDVTGWILD